MSQYNYSQQHVRDVKRKCKLYMMSAPKKFWEADIPVLQRCYNGIGPDAWSTRRRAWVTKALERFEACALPHDWEYTYQPKNYWRFTIANLRFAWNAMLEAIAVKDIKLFWVGLGLAVLCQAFGWGGYKQGGKHVDRP